ncbi:hypothetical protein BD410DRAFT_789886 [Rickenella mellea]|uniref:C2H2-type domain-containing protein n=1 Tax=Rickenella mellea TaxID=50990 RepID=A0A4Y7Q1B6_9AGAM|nr:hypothetical protein BD410DRAFT_789886 [Rickenella mellea]
MSTPVDRETDFLWQAIELLILHSLDAGVSYNTGSNQKADLTFHVSDRPSMTRHRVYCEDVYPHQDSSHLNPVCDLAGRSQIMTASHEFHICHRKSQAEVGKDTRGTYLLRYLYDKPLPPPPVSRWSLNTSEISVPTDSYRPGLHSFLPELHSDSESSSLTSGCYSEFDKYSIVPQDGPSARISTSLTRSLAEAAIEANFIAERSKFNLQTIRCQYPECLDFFPDEKALKFHIHMHKLHYTQSKPVNTMSEIFRRMFKSVCCTHNNFLEK